MNNVFPELNTHMIDTPVTENHTFMLIKAVARNFLKSRMHHLAKKMNQNLVRNDRVRKKLTKLIHFKGQ